MTDFVPGQRKVVRMPNTVSVFGPFRFDWRTGRLSRDGEELHLTTRVSGVLRCLLDGRGAVVTKDELFNDVWKAAGVTDDALLQVVSVLRKTLGDDPRSPEYIHTVTGEGYRFIGEVFEEPAAPVAVSRPKDAPGAAETTGASPASSSSREAVLRPVSSTPDAARAPWSGYAAVVVVAVIAIGWGAWSGGFRGAPDTGAVDERASIAVLPFVNIGNDPDNEYFSDGLAEELLVRLARVKALRVAARTSSFSFRGQGRSIDMIAAALGVDTVLEGSARRDGDLVPVVARLVSADGFELWSDEYEMRYDDVFTIQEDIARRVVEALTIPLLGEDAVLLARTPTSDPAAYEMYMKGQWFLARYTVDGYRTAARNFQDALALDPEFSLAYVGLADAYLLQNRYGPMPLDEALAVAGPAIDRAMQYEPLLGEAHAMMGLVQQMLDNREEARASYERAIDLAPDAPRAYQLY